MSMSDASEWPDLSGRLIRDENGARHVFPVRVYFEDTDAGGVIYHASYIKYCERGRTELLRLLGTDARRMIDGSGSTEPAAFVVRRMVCDFLRSGRMDDLLLVTTNVKELGGASVTLHQVVSAGDQKLFEADVVVVLISMAGKPLRLPSDVRAAFEASGGTRI